MSKSSRRFLFLGGIPVFDTMLSVHMDELRKATSDKVLIVGDRLLLPVGTVFEFNTRGMPGKTYLNPLANGAVQHVHHDHYYALEFGGKHPEGSDLSLCTDKGTILRQLRDQYPDAVKKASDLKVVKVSTPAEIVLGGNNKNIIEGIKTLYGSPELAGDAHDIRFEHHFFFDTGHPKFRLVEDLYSRLEVSLGDRADLHVDGLVPRIGYVLTLHDDDGRPKDRIILANRTNEEIIPTERLLQKYARLEYSLRRDEQFLATHLVINSMTNQEELRLVVRLLQTAFASGVCTTVCPTLTLLNSMERLIQAKYYTTELERFFSFRKDFIETAIIPHVQTIILNKTELGMMDNTAEKRGIDAAASMLSGRMNRGREAVSREGGKVVVTGGSKGARFTERLSHETAMAFWQKANLPDGSRVRFAERRIVCGDDYVTGLTSTLGAGDVFTGIVIGLNALGWDGGHALRAATLGAQHFIQTREKPTIGDMIAVDDNHVLLGTETELSDVISHHLEDSGDPTRYGTISNTLITVSTTQIQHPFREILQVARRMAANRLAKGESCLR